MHAFEGAHLIHRRLARLYGAARHHREIDPIETELPDNIAHLGITHAAERFR